MPTKDKRFSNRMSRSHTTIDRLNKRIERATWRWPEIGLMGGRLIAASQGSP
jgi:hypothetical protein